MNEYQKKVLGQISGAELVALADDLKSITENSEQIETLSQRAADSAEQGFKALADVQTTLKTFVDGTANINELLETIDLLSQQVHILGVNAAIEAANAGEHGSGFTIIAEEMRRIAGQVKETAHGVQSIMGVTGALADETVVAIEMASENLEVLELSAGLSMQLNHETSEKAAIHRNNLDNSLHVDTEAEDPEDAENEGDEYETEDEIIQDN